MRCVCKLHACHLQSEQSFLMMNTETVRDSLSNVAAEVESKLGVKFVLVGTQGLDRATFDQGILEWRKRTAP